MSKQFQTCFVIMPFGDSAAEVARWTNHYEDFLKPLIEEIPELEATRARPIGGDLVGQVITQLITSPVVVADLTGNNPNVQWELGVRHSFKNRTVLIDESRNRPIFDLASVGVLSYGERGKENPNFKKQFQDSLRDCLKEPDRPDSPVFLTISGRGSLFELIQRDQATRRSLAILSEMERNVEVAEMVKDRLKKNKSRTGRAFSVVTGRMRSAAVELLITDRYLDESEEFYQLAEYYYDWIPRMNETLNDWRQNRKRVEGWLSTNTSRAVRSADRFRIALSKARKNLTTVV